MLLLRLWVLRNRWVMLLRQIYAFGRFLLMVMKGVAIKKFSDVEQKVGNARLKQVNNGMCSSIKEHPPNEISFLVGC